MLRIYKEFAKQLFATLIYMKYGVMGGKVDGKLAKEFILNWNRRRGEVGDNIFYATDDILDYDHPDTFKFDTDQLTESLANLINGRVESNHYSDLIDSIAEVLKKPRASQVLSGKTLEQLKKAILTPDELAGLKKRLRDIEMSCYHCGRELVSGDMLTMTRDSNTGENVIYCSNCTLPSYMMCRGKDKCEDRVQIPPRTRTALKNLSTKGCPNCQSRKHEGPEVVNLEGLDVTAEVLDDGEEEHFNGVEEEEDWDLPDDEDDGIRFVAGNELTDAPTPPAGNDPLPHIWYGAAGGILTTTTNTPTPTITQTVTPGWMDEGARINWQEIAERVRHTGPTMPMPTRNNTLPGVAQFLGQITALPRLTHDEGERLQMAAMRQREQIMEE